MKTGYLTNVLLYPRVVLLPINLKHHRWRSFSFHMPYIFCGHTIALSRMQLKGTFLTGNINEILTKKFCVSHHWGFGRNFRWIKTEGLSKKWNSGIQWDSTKCIMRYYVFYSSFKWNNWIWYLTLIPGKKVLWEKYSLIKRPRKKGSLEKNPG